MKGVCSCNLGFLLNSAFSLRVHMPPFLSYCSLSSSGQKTPDNQDAWLHQLDQNCFMLADGMGGYRAGRVAAHLSLLCFQKLLQRSVISSFEDLREKYMDFLSQADRYLKLRSQSQRAWKGMGTTFCSLSFHEDFAFCLHLGNSRIYCLREELLIPLTKDHSLSRELQDVALLKEEERFRFSFRHVLTQALGRTKKIDPSFSQQKWEKGDLYFLCSDGISDSLSDPELREILLEKLPLKDIAHLLVQRAREKGSHDDITLSLVRL